ncbi:aminotransferase class IV family protein [Photobacterium sp. WH24]|uniref:aminotransferase class IV family protein n=1 Tax=Photobacterium sp. WH24 TaxID=2827237 RepID=UPI001C475CAF|nr:aminotransferase class IV family protein [Photobacterium sp. WH24]MBV7263498.1 aminotransferase class IV family protein [Photobacterium sp. WH24]
MPNQATAVINGQLATGSQLSVLTFAGHAHFTAMQVRNGKIRGLDLHIERLQQASHHLFGKSLSNEAILHQIRDVLRSGENNRSLMVYVYSDSGEFTPREDSSRLNILIRQSAASDGPHGPLTMKTFAHERILPSIKHVGEIAKTHLMRQAVNQGFDDAIFTDNQGRLTEASIWNLAFWDGEAVIWPKGAKLRGTTMQIVQRQLDAMQIPQQEQNITETNLLCSQAAAVMNSWTPGIAISKINTTHFSDTSDFIALLHHAFANEALITP